MKIYIKDFYYDFLQNKNKEIYTVYVETLDNTVYVSKRMPEYRQNYTAQQIIEAIVKRKDYRFI